MPPVTIRRGAFKSTLYDIDSFIDLPLTNLRKLWKIMFTTYYENGATILQVLDWLPTKAAETKNHIQALESELADAKTDAENKRRAAASWGGELDSRITQAKRQLQNAKRRKDTARIKVATDILAKVSRPKTEYEEEVKNVRLLENMIKTAKVRLNKTEKLQSIFNEMRI